MYKITRFTLIELIVSISILAVLASLLQPAFLKSIENANYVRCSHNYKRIHISFELYINDHERYPYSFTNRHFSDIGGLTWDDQLGLGYDGRQLDYNYALRWNNLKTDPGMNDSLSEQYICPNDTEVRGTSNNVIRSYALNVNQQSRNMGGFANTWDRVARTSVSPNDVPAPSKTFLLAEFLKGNLGSGGGASIGNTRYQYQVQNYTPIHQGDYNYLFSDGHTEKLYKDDTVNLNKSPYVAGSFWTRDPED